MPDSKITALTALTSADPANDMFPIVDVSDTSMAASGTTKRISINNLLAASGTATLASATISGDLTVDTSTLKVDSANNRVGIGTASPTTNLHVGSGVGLNNLGVGLSRGATTNFYEAFDGTKSFLAGTDSSQTGVKVGALSNHSMFLVCNNVTQLQIDPLGVFTFGDGAGGTRMTLNSTGLGVGASPANDKLLSLGSMGILLSGATSDFSFRNSGGTAIQRLRYTDATGALTIGSATGTAYPVELGGNTTTRAVTIDASSNVGIGVTPSALTNVNRLEIGGQLGSNVTLRSTSTSPSARNWMVAANAVSFGDFAIRQGNSQGAEPNSGTDRLYIDPSGNLILQSSATPATLTTNGQLTVNATSNTNLRFSYRGSDGVTRTADLTLA